MKLFSAISVVLLLVSAVSCAHNVSYAKHKRQITTVTTHKSGAVIVACKGINAFLTNIDEAPKSQQWTYTPVNGRLTGAGGNAGKCLAILDNPHEGSVIGIAKCSRGTRQKWIADPTVDDYTWGQLRSAANPLLCLSSGEGDITLFTCNNGEDSQLWSMTLPAPIEANEGTQYIYNLAAYEQNILRVVNPSVTLKVSTLQYVGDAQGQGWIFDGQNIKSGINPQRCLDLTKGLKVGSPVGTKPCNQKSKTQQWTYDRETQWATIRPAGNQALCLAPSGGKTQAGTGLLLATCGDASTQMWSIASYPIDTHTEPPQNYEFLGCFADNLNYVAPGNQRDLPFLAGQNTDEVTCPQICADEHYSYAGLNSDRDCFCGNGPYGKFCKAEDDIPCQYAHNWIGVYQAIPDSGLGQAAHCQCGNDGEFCTDHNVRSPNTFLFNKATVNYLQDREAGDNGGSRLLTEGALIAPQRGATSQIWSFLADSTIRVFNDRCLTHSSDSDVVYTATCTDGLTGQQWTYELVPDTWSVLSPVGMPESCLAPYDAEIDEDTPTTLVACSESIALKWSVPRPTDLESGDVYIFSNNAFENNKYLVLDRSDDPPTMKKLGTSDQQVWSYQKTRSRDRFLIQYGEGCLGVDIETDNIVRLLGCDSSSASQLWSYYRSSCNINDICWNYYFVTIPGHGILYASSQGENGNLVVSEEKDETMSWDNRVPSASSTIAPTIFIALVVLLVVLVH